MPDIFSPSQKKEHPKHEHMPKKEHSPLPEHHHSYHFYSAFAEKPKNMSFTNQEPGEEIILFMRRHFITNIPWVVFTILLVFFPILISLAFQSANFSLTFLPTRFFIILSIFYYLIVFGFALSNFSSWFYNIGMITTKRLVDIDFTNLTTVDVSATTLVEVEDVDFTQNGFVESMFNYGTITARTLGGKSHFVFEKVPYPNRVVNLLSQLLGESK